MTLRLCTFNVHSWVDARGRTRVDDTLALLRGLACDVLTLNEVPDDSVVRRVADQLGMQLAYAPASWAGNALLSRHPLRHVEKVVLDTFGGEARSAAIARVDVAGLALDIACTHLDHHDEATRRAQLELLHPRLGVRASAFAAFTVLGGDFNALRLDDYPAEHLELVRSHRALNHRPPPVGDVVDQMDRWGYTDAARLADVAPGESYAASLGRPISPTLRSTCWAGTRIDHMWLDAALAARVRGVEALVVDTDVSDHQPGVVTLQL